MILTEYVEIKIGSKNRKYYLDKGYLIEKETLNVRTEDLLPTTRVLVNAKCDYCFNIIETTYKNYNSNITKNGKFSCCAKCTTSKTKEIIFEKYGVEYSNQRDDIKIKTYKNSINNVKRYDPSLLSFEKDWMKYLLTKEVLVTINKWNIEHLIQIGYENLRQNTKCIIPVTHLMPNSSMKVECVCECGNITKTSFQKFMTNYNRSNSYNCKACNNITLKKTCLEKYGVDNTSKLEYVNEKRKKTCLEKYGNEYAIASEQTKEKTKNTLNERYGGHQSKVPEIQQKIKTKGKITKIKRGLVISDDKLSLWELYRRKVSNITNKYKNKLYEDWDGLDYYDGEYIKDNFNMKHTDNEYPTIDHKISLLYGFKNNISPDIIGEISNLCITKRKNNSSKSGMTEEEYLNKKNQS